MIFRKVSWEEIDEICTRLAQVIRKCYSDVKFIYGIPRGGLVPAVIMSHLLDIELVKDLPANARKEEYLVIDDINDSGRTLKKYTQEGYLTAALFGRASADSFPFFIAEEISNDDWLVYPWEPYEKAEKEYLEYTRKCLT